MSQIKNPSVFFSQEDIDNDLHGIARAGATSPGWYFWDEKAERHGPFASDEAAIQGRTDHFLAMISVLMHERLRGGVVGRPSVSPKAFVKQVLAQHPDAREFQEHLVFLDRNDTACPADIYTAAVMMAFSVGYPVPKPGAALPDGSYVLHNQEGLEVGCVVAVTDKGVQFVVNAPCNFINVTLTLTGPKEGWE